MNGDFPSCGGTYVLLMESTQTLELDYGRRRFQVRSGCYLYVGSAFGPGGLAARLGHHLRRARRPRWHIDHLRRHLPIRKIWYSVADQHLEHRWADELGRRCDAIVARFGASDCRCAGHLFHFEQAPAIECLATDAADAAVADPATTRDRTHGA